MVNDFENQSHRIYNKYLGEDVLYQQKLQQKLKEYKKTLETTNVEIAQGLRINRQSLINFLNIDFEKIHSDKIDIYEKDPLEKLKIKIERRNLLQLHEYLTNTTRIENNKKLSSQAKLRRQELKENGVEELLLTAGFITGNKLTNSKPKQVDIFSSIIRRLTDLYDIDPVEFLNFKNQIEKVIGEEIKKLKLALSASNDNTKKIKSNSNYLKEFLTEKASGNNKIYQEYKKQFERLESLGKSEFIYREVYELCDSILENNMPNLALQVKKCEFTVSSFDLLEKAKNLITKDNHLQELFYLIRNTSKRCDELLGQNLVSESVINTVISFSYQGDKNDEDIILEFNFSSSAPHIANAIITVMNRMGCSSSIEMKNSSIEALGIGSQSLVKTGFYFQEVNNENNRNFYEGRWVSENMIIGTIQAVVNAAIQWLSLTLSNEEYQVYYHKCEKVNNIQNDIFKMIKALDEYNLITDNPTSEDYLYLNFTFTEIIDKINNLKKDLINYHGSVFKYYNKYLDKNIYIIKLMIIYAALFKGDLDQAFTYLRERKYIEENKIYEPITILYTAGNLMYEFLTGDPHFIDNFIDEKKWAKEFNSFKTTLLNYIKTTTFSEESSSNGYLDNTKYRSASEIHGNIGTIEFYLLSHQIKNLNNDSQHNTQENERNKKIEQIIEHFISAAYYTSKVGQKQRTAHWLLMASRTYCRAGKIKESDLLIKLSEDILNECIDPRYSEQNKDYIKSEVELVKGEKYLLNDDEINGKNEKEKAIECFLKSLKGGIHLGFALLISDSLYNIYRIDAKLNNDGELLKQKYKEIFEDKRQDSNNDCEVENDFFDREKNRWKNNKIILDVIDFLNKSELPESDAFKKQAINIWNYWFDKRYKDTNNKKHHIAKMMEEDILLN